MVLFRNIPHKWVVWVIAISFIPGSNILIIQQLLHAKRNDLLILFFEPAIAIAFGIVFFAPLWTKLNIKHEGELILERFQGKSAKILFNFRNIFLALIVVPLMISIQLVSFEVLSDLELKSGRMTQLVIVIVLLITYKGYDFLNLITIELLVAAITIALSIAHLITANHPSALNTELWSSIEIDRNLLFIPLLFLWWFAGIVDMPDMRAQKLISMKNTGGIRWKMLIPFAAVFVIQSIFLWKPLCVSHGLFYPIVVILILNSIVLLLGLTYWANSLLKLSVPYIRNVKAERQKKILNFLPFFIGLLWFLWGRDMQNLFSSFLLITAGVGPIYMLRWIWYRINAWTQMSAMIGAIVIAPITSILFKDLHYYHLLLITGGANLIVALIVMNSTRNLEDEMHAKKFITQIESIQTFKRTSNWVYFIVYASLFIGLLLLFRLF